jgi:hypothetical protein
MDNFKDITVILGHHPIMGAILSISQIAAAYFIAFNVELPLILMQLCQIAAWLGATGVAVLTILGWFRNNTTLLDKWKWLKEKK